LKKHFGCKLRRARWDRRISIADIVDESGLDKKSVINFELHGSNCRIDTLWKICKATGISADYILGFSNEPYVENTLKQKSTPN
jgi:transcriptional regulator with XRE-family HTH domain